MDFGAQNMTGDTRKLQTTEAVSVSQVAGCPPLVLQTPQLTLLILELSTSPPQLPTLSHTTGTTHTCLQHLRPAF